MGRNGVGLEMQYLVQSLLRFPEFASSQVELALLQKRIDVLRILLQDARQQAFRLRQFIHFQVRLQQSGAGSPIVGMGIEYFCELGESCITAAAVIKKKGVDRQVPRIRKGSQPRERLLRLVAPVRRKLERCNSQERRSGLWVQFQRFTERFLRFIGLVEHHIKLTKRQHRQRGLGKLGSGFL